MEKQMDSKQLKQLHLTQVEILDEVVRICKKNNLKYFLIGGTLLGAVRHKGFIPWDDDLDIAMPRKDYEEFLNIAKNELNAKYFIDNFDTNNLYYLNFTKVRKKGTLFVQGFQTKYTGPKEIWIDIFPLDDWKRERGMLQDIRVKWIKLLRSVAHYNSGFYLNSKKIFIKKCIGFFTKPIKAGHIMKYANKLMKKYSEKQTDYYINISSQYNYKKQTILKNKFLPTKELVFEGKKYTVPGDYDYILKRIYGDYMKLPPKEKRITHNPEILSFNEDIEWSESNDSKKI